MAANQSIKELMAAETKASKIVSDARQERGERLKQAKTEAQIEIDTYRQQLENTYQLNGTDLLGDNAQSLEQEDLKEIEKLKSDFNSNKSSALDLMVNQACTVVLKVPEARKQ